MYLGLPNLAKVSNFRKVIPKVIITVLLFVGICHTQPDTLWTKTYGGTGNDQAYCVQQTSDGGFIITGSTYSFGAGDSDLWLIRTNSQGEIIWTKTYGGLTYERGWSVQQTSDNGFIIVGETATFGPAEYCVYLLKTDANGDTLWTETFGETGYSHGYSVKELTNGYILTGSTDSYGAQDVDILLIKTDLQGNSVWVKTFGGTFGDRGYDLEITMDGGFIITGYMDASGAGTANVLLLKTDADGNLTWLKSIGGSNEDKGNSVLQVSNGNYIIIGDTESAGAGDSDVWIIETDVNGDTLWTKTFGGISSDYGFSVKEIINNGFIICGETYSYGAGGHDLWLVRTDLNGDSIWTKTIGGTNNDIGRSINLTTDGGFIIAGNTESYGSGQNDVWLIRLDDDTPPQAPQNLTATPGNNLITLRWRKNIEADLSKYRIYRGESSPASTLIDSCVASSPPDTFYIDTGLTNGLTYYYRATAVDSAGNESGYSNEVNAIPKPIVITIKTDATGDFTSIQAGIDSSSEGDTILVYPGVYYDAFDGYGENIYIGSLHMITDDTSYISQTIIDGSQNANNLSSLVTNCRYLHGITIQNDLGNSPTIGYWSISNIVANHLVVENNGSQSAGSAFLFHNSSGEVIETVIINNSAGEGAGAAFYNSDIIFKNVEFFDNSSSSDGGALSIVTASNVIIYNSIISGNHADDKGGAIYITGASSITLINTTIHGNSSAGTDEIGNIGDIYEYHPQNTTFSHINAINTIVWDDNIYSGNWNGEDLHDEYFSISYSDIEGGWPGTGNINSDPLFIDPGNSDFQLQASSPCIDAGNPDLDGDGITWQWDTDDQDPDGSRMDMGTYSFNQMLVQPDNYSLQFDGVDDYAVVYADYGPDNIGQDRTIAAWVKLSTIPNITPQTQDSIAYAVAITPSTTVGYNIASWGGFGVTVYGEARFRGAGYSNTTTAWETVTSTTTANSGEWYYLTLSYDSDSLRLFVNGEQEAVRQFPGFSATVVNNKAISFGCLLSPSINIRFFPGLIDEVRLWNRALSKSEIKTKMYNHLDPSQEISLVGYWKYNEGFGSTIHDSSLYTNNGTIQGAIWSTDVPTMDPPPSIPHNVTAYAGNRKITLSWNSNHEPDLAMFRIYRGTASPASILIDSCVASSPPDTFYIDTGLTNGLTYYYRVTAVDSAGNESGYSNEDSAIPGKTVTDIDGNIYSTVIVGDQIWMTENLKVIHYRNGDPIPDMTGSSGWGGLTSGAWCAYNNDYTHIAEYGRLYNWYSINDSRNITPVGWHLPTDNDWKQLEKYLGMSQSEADDTNDRGTVEGGKLKETGFTHWYQPNTGATNEHGYTALPGGYRYYNGDYFNLGYTGYWWSTTGYNDDTAWGRALSNTSSKVYRNNYSKNYGFSVRCVRDTSIAPNTPQNLSIFASNQRIILRWNANTEPDVAKYRIYRGLSSPAGFLIDSCLISSPPDTFYTDSDLTNGQIYYYRITAVDANGNESGYSNEVSAIPTPQLYTVKKDGTGDYTSIQTAINASAHGDTVLVHPGIYMENINLNEKNIVVGSLCLINNDTLFITQTIIDANSLGTVVTIDGGQDTTSLLYGLTIRNGNANSEYSGYFGGGVIY